MKTWPPHYFVFHLVAFVTSWIGVCARSGNLLLGRLHWSTWKLSRKRSVRCLLWIYIQTAAYRFWISLPRGISRNWACRSVVSDWTTNHCCWQISEAARGHCPANDRAVLQMKQSSGPSTGAWSSCKRFFRIHPFFIMPRTSRMSSKKVKFAYSVMVKDSLGLKWRRCVSLTLWGFIVIVEP